MAMKNYFFPAHVMILDTFGTRGEFIRVQMYTALIYSEKSEKKEKEKNVRVVNNNNEFN